jgi:hypothetical protein
MRGEDVTTAMRLLKAVAGELRDLAVDTAHFGESLSKQGNIADNNSSIRLMQKFDLFSQSLHAHATLIESLSVRLDQGKIETAELEELIKHIPFFSVRERLKAVVTGVAQQPHKDDTEDDWYLDE